MTRLAVFQGSLISSRPHILVLSTLTYEFLWCCFQYTLLDLCNISIHCWSCILYCCWRITIVLNCRYIMQPIVAILFSGMVLYRARSGWLVGGNWWKSPKKLCLTSKRFCWLACVSFDMPNDCSVVAGFIQDQIFSARYVVLSLLFYGLIWKVHPGICSFTIGSRV